MSNAKRTRAHALPVMLIGVPAMTFGLGACGGGGGGPSSLGGPLVATCTQTRTSGVSPLTVFFDATGTTSGATGKPFTQIHYSWNFGDSGTSGTGTWKYGSNPGQNSMNTATGAVAAHVFVTSGSDRNYAITMTAFDGASTSTCHMTVTAYNPSGSNGYPNSATTCVYNATVGSGCPLNASKFQTLNFDAALNPAYIGNGKRVLFKCGDTFSGSGATISGSNWRVGAYGGCEGTSAGRPILNAASNGERMITIAQTASDGAIADLDFEGNGNLPFPAIGGASTTSIPSKITLINLAANNVAAAYWSDQGKEWAIFGSTAFGMDPNDNNIQTFLNTSEWNPGNDVSYQALIGNSFDGNGGCVACSGGQETVRISACAKCVISDNDVKNANSVGAVLKFHQGNTNNSNSNWVGSYSETTIISDNHFSGSSGANLVEVAPQNSVTDERLRDIVIERNFFQTSISGGRELLVSGQDIAVRDNIFSLGNMDWGVQIGQRGNFSWQTTGVEAYNNTCYSPSSRNNQRCIVLSNTTLDGATEPYSCTVKNTLAYFPSSSGAATITNDGAGNILSNNTTSVTANPVFTNGTGSFAATTDFRPQANYSGGAAVPVPYDFFGTSWNGTWDLGAVHH